MSGQTARRTRSPTTGMSVSAALLPPLARKAPRSRLLQPAGIGRVLRDPRGVQQGGRGTTIETNRVRVTGLCGRSGWQEHVRKVRFRPFAAAEGMDIAVVEGTSAGAAG